MSSKYFYINFLLLLCLVPLIAEDTGYQFKLPADKTVTIKIPASCIQYHNRIPAESDSFNPVPHSNAAPFYQALLKVYEKMANNIDQYMGYFDFNYAVIKEEKRLMEAQMTELTTLQYRMENFDIDSGGLDALNYYMEILQEFNTLIDGLGSVKVEKPDTLKPLPAAEKRELFKEICTEAFQSACWMNEEDYIAEIEAKEKNESSYASYAIAKALVMAANQVLQGNGEK